MYSHPEHLKQTLVNWFPDQSSASVSDIAEKAGMTEHQVCSSYRPLEVIWLGSGSLHAQGGKTFVEVLKSGE